MPIEHDLRNPKRADYQAAINQLEKIRQIVER
jgi:hypothetical protein